MIDFIILIDIVFCNVIVDGVVLGLVGIVVCLDGEINVGVYGVVEVGGLVVMEFDMIFWFVLMMKFVIIVVVM